MIPIHAHSGLTRKAQFVKEEWDVYFSNNRVDAMEDGWRALIYGNYALANPTAAWNYFSASNFNTMALDGGASRSWYLAMAAMLGGVS